MASLVSGYNYDIFISYRQKDNKHDGWVTEFVDNLKGELESTFKEEISVYFDINPHDGLLETHDVDASLKDKLMCLIFIPIISRTYCDPKSFAWEHEFKAFVEQASQDQFGLKVKLPNGNVAYRVLPVRIHDLDASDIKECESVLGGVLRGIEFIYKETGIDKPLSPGDNEKKNLNNTTYRIQIIKVAHSIKEIILGMKNEPSQVVSEKEQPKESVKEAKAKEPEEVMEKPGKLSKVKFLTLLAILALLIIAGIIAYPKIFKRNTLDRLRSSGERISVAVMPFQNMTNDTSKNVWQYNIQNILITSLSNSPDELKVCQALSINNLIKDKGLADNVSLTSSLASIISQKLEANVFICGDIKKAGSVLRVNAQLIDSKTEEVLKSFQKEGVYREENILRIIDSLSTDIKNFLLISRLKKEVYLDFQQVASSTSPEAYQYFTYGQKAFGNGDFSTAINLLSQAVKIDSNFTYAISYIAHAYRNLGNFEEGKEWCLKAYNKKDQMPTLYQKIYTNYVYSCFFETPNEVIKELKQLLDIDNQVPQMWYNLGFYYNALYQYDNAIQALEQSLDLYTKNGLKPFWLSNYTLLGVSYHKTGQYKKEKKLYKKAEQYFPDKSSIIYRQAVLALFEGKTQDANDYIEKYISIGKENGATEAAISTNLGAMYSEAEIQDKAEEFYRQALSFEPENPVRFNNLAYFLINKDRNINEGLEIVEKVLELSPDDYPSLHTKGWGLYKQGKYQEAFEILQKSWDLRMKNAIYDHGAYLHLEEAKKAIAGQKSN
jgi:tetratricopeptide (TPR) repeat protein